MSELLVDTDVHEYMRSWEDLLPHLPERFRPYITNHDFNGKRTQIGNGYPYAAPLPKRNEWLEPDGRVNTDTNTLRKHLIEGLGVTTPILNGFTIVSAMTGSFEFAAALACAYNDWQIENWLDKDRDLRGSVHVVAQDPAGAVREIDRIAGHPQVVQVFLPLVTDRQYGDPYYFPIFEAAASHGLAVTFHHGQATGNLFGYPRYFVEWHTLAQPAAAQHQLLSLVMNGVFDRLPELKVVFLETGVAWVPWFMWRMDQQYKEARAEVPWVKRLPSEHVRDNVRVSTQPMGDVTADQFAQLVEMAGTDSVYVFSSDYPHYDADTPDHVLGSTLPRPLRERVRYRNALETFPRLASLAGA